MEHEILALQLQKSSARTDRGLGKTSKCLRILVLFKDTGVKSCQTQSEYLSKISLSKEILCAAKQYHEDALNQSA